MGSVWNPDQYERFAEERRQPFFDLLDLVVPSEGPAPEMRVIDLGCGTGELTRSLHERLQARTTLGVDRSETMLERSAEHVCAGLSFQLTDLADALDGQRFDLVFSNAALQWVDDHEALFGRLAAALEDGGQLAVQVPANHDTLANRTAVALAAEEPFRSELDGWERQWSVLAPEAYAVLLDRLGFTEQKVFLRVYAHSLPSRDSVLEWIAGTYLKPYQARLSAASWTLFHDTLAERLRDVLEDRAPYFYPFKRVFLWARA